MRVNILDTCQKRYRAILADPPWTYATWSDNGKDRSPEKHYDCMSYEEIATLPVANVAEDDCILFLWTTDWALPRALEIIGRWGFTFKTVGFTWAKLNKSAEPYPEPRNGWCHSSFFTGMGWWTRANPEICLLATRGRPQRLAMDVRQLIIAPRREHSRKPDEIYRRIQRLVPGPYLELFARTEAPGWDCWGNETDRFVKGSSVIDIDTSSVV